jgi:hypothetical protein
MMLFSFVPRESHGQQGTQQGWSIRLTYGLNWLWLPPPSQDQCLTRSADTSEAIHVVAEQLGTCLTKSFQKYELETKLRRGSDTN